MNWFAKLFEIFARRADTLSINCKEAARLQSAALDRRLTPLERFGLRCHVALCKWCNRYGRQIQFIRTAARTETQAEVQLAAPRLPGEARERIKQRLRAETGQG